MAISLSPSPPSKTDYSHMQAGFDKPRYVCRKCSACLALQDELVSKAFSGREGRALLLHSVINVRVGKSEDRMLLTGKHTVADIFCAGCESNLGWTYLKAFNATQKYKEGKYIVETQRIAKENNWVLDDGASP